MEVNAEDGPQGPEAPPGGAEPAGQPAGTAEPAPEAAGRAEEYLQSLQRLKADFDNYRRRMTADQARWGDTAVAGFILQLLPVVDNLERALLAAGDAQAVRQGVELTVRQLHDVLGKAGVRPLETRGQPFDPALHEAVARGPEPGLAEGLVAEEYSRGYLFRERVLRPATVRVADGSGASDPEAAAGREGGQQ